MHASNELPVWHGTTILTVRKGGKVVIGGDGQVSIGQTVIKANAKKVRKAWQGRGDRWLCRRQPADAFTLFERLESKLEQYPGQLTRAAVELAKDWRTDRYLRRLEAMMIVGRQGRVTGADRHRRRAGTRGRRDGDRLRRQLRAGRGAGVDRQRARCRKPSCAARSTSPPDIFVFTNRKPHHRDVAGWLGMVAAYTYRPMTSADLPKVAHWLQTPEVVRWWGDPHEQYELVSGDLTHPDMDQFIVSIADRPFAYIQCYRLSTWNQGFGAQPADTRGIDQFIGEPDLVGCGHGSRFIRQLTDDFLQRGHTAHRDRSRS